MTVTTTIICDECGKDITAANDRIEAKVSISHPRWSVGEPEETIGKADFCQSCWAKLALVCATHNAADGQRPTVTDLIRALVRDKIRVAS